MRPHAPTSQFPQKFGVCSEISTKLDETRPRSHMPLYEMHRQRQAKPHRAARRAQLYTSDRGRDAHYWAPPAQIRTCGFPAYGSHLGCVTARRCLTPPVCAPAPVTRCAGSAPGARGAGTHSPRPLPFAPPAPQRIAPPCSPASPLLRQGLTSHARASSASALRLPDADQNGLSPVVRRETSQVPTRSLCA